MKTRRQFLLFDFKDEMRKIHNDWCLANDVPDAQIRPHAVEDDIEADSRNSLIACTSRPWDYAERD